MKFRYDTQIESQPDAVEAVLRRPVPRLDRSRPLLFCGQGTSLPAARGAAARRLAGKDPLLVTGFGLDAIAAAEAALKLKEATFQWAEGLSVEQALHGPQAALRQGMGAILFVPDDDDGGRTVRLRELCAAVGVEVVDIPVARCSAAVRPLVSIVPAQRLAGEIARLTGGDPDRSRNPV